METQTVEAIKLVISVLALVLSSVSLTSIIIYLSARTGVCNQIYSRWQTLLLAQDKDTHTYLKTEEYKEDKERDKAHYIAIAYLNLYEEAFFYHKTKVLWLFPMLPKTLWLSIKRSMNTQLNDLKYLKTLWQKRSDSYAKDFVDCVQKEII